jgi:trigger factor
MKVLSKIIYPVIIVLVLLGLGGAIYYSKVVAPDNKYDEELGYNVDDYITLGQYKGIEAEQEVYEVTDDDIEEAIESELTEEVEIDREFVKGDYVNIDITATIDDSYVEDLSYEDYDICIGDNDYVSDLDDALIGKTVGSTFNVTTKDIGELDDSYEGETVDLYVVVNSGTAYETNELTEEYVQENYGYDTIDEFREAIKENLEEEYENDNKLTMEESVWEIVVDNATMKGYPEDLYEEVSETSYSSLEEEAEAWGLELTEYLEMFYEVDEDGLEDFLNEYYEDEVKSELVLRAIVKKENLEVTDEKYAELIDDYLYSYDYDSQEDFEDDYGVDAIKDAMLMDVVYEFLGDNAKVTYVEAEDEDLDSEELDLEDTDSDTEEIDLDESDSDTEEIETEEID